MKRLFFLSLLLIIVLSFIPISGQDNMSNTIDWISATSGDFGDEPTAQAGATMTDVYNNFYFDLVGKDFDYVKKNYPLFDMIPKTSSIFPGQYVVYEMNCEDGGYISVIVEFLQRQLTRKVRSVGMFMEGCWTDPQKPDSIYDALALFSYYYGFNSIANEAKITVENPNMVMMIMPDTIIFGVFKEKFNGRTVFTASAGTVLE